MFPYDSALLSTVQSQPQNIPGVLHILQTIDSTCADADGLKWFNWLYLQVTAAVQARVAAGGFSDATWLAELDVQFARLYFSALRSSLSGLQTPGCWSVLFAARNRNEIARIQFALAGINAHINHDLAEAIVNTCQATGTTPTYKGLDYVNYTALNSTLDSLVESAKKTLWVRLPGDALPAVSHLEATLAAFSVAAARESAWLNGDRLWRIRHLPEMTASFLEMLDGMTSVIGKALLAPAPPGC